MNKSQKMIAECNELYQRRISTMRTEQAMKQLLTDFRSGSDQIKESMFACVVMAHATARAKSELQQGVIA
jgi:hypothetical protein